VSHILGRSVGIVRSRTKGHGVCLFVLSHILINCKNGLKSHFNIIIDYLLTLCLLYILQTNYHYDECQLLKYGAV
jgi:hypothetical protein